MTNMTISIARNHQQMTNNTDDNDNDNEHWDFPCYMHDGVLTVRSLPLPLDWHHQQMQDDAINDEINDDTVTINEYTEGFERLRHITWLTPQQADRLARRILEVAEPMIARMQSEPPF